ncbi:MAG: MBL fold metallo-hydrolase [bacterium]
MRRFPFKYLTIVLAITLLATLNTWNKFQAIPQGVQPLQVSFLDVGQGDAIYIRAPNGNDILIDGGPDNSVMAQLRQIMPVYDTDIGIIIATHPDKDHIAGLIPVFEKYDVKKYIHSEISSGTSFDTSLKEHATQEPELEEIIAKRGQRYILDNNQGVYLDILYPNKDTSDFKDTNGASIVARLVYNQQSFLLTGDAPIATETFLNHQDGLLLGSTVLKLGHHGSKTSSSDQFLKTVHPQYAIVSAGKNNRYRHPSSEVVDRISHYPITLLSTMDSGTITFETNGVTLTKK